MRKLDSHLRQALTEVLHTVNSYIQKSRKLRESVLKDQALLHFQMAAHAEIQTISDCIRGHDGPTRSDVAMIGMVVEDGELDKRYTVLWRCRKSNAKQ